MTWEEGTQSAGCAGRRQELWLGDQQVWGDGTGDKTGGEESSQSYWLSLGSPG